MRPNRKAWEEPKPQRDMGNHELEAHLVEKEIFIQNLGWVMTQTKHHVKNCYLQVNPEDYIDREWVVVEYDSHPNRQLIKIDGLDFGEITEKVARYIPL